MSLIKGLTKTILYVKDIDTQVQFYRDRLGLEVKSSLSIPGRSDKQWVEFATGECTLVLHGNLAAQHGKDRPKLAFHVNDIQIAYKELSDRGVKLSPIRSPSPGLQIAEGADPEGNPFTIDCQS
ncbi:VOC family protein [Calothrix sp. FACHB-1219]|uniref:VOC family protein n=1 Tax=unclassified Calothrix TaxID=2619626 RepID=UPI001681F3C1|nr:MULTISPECIES: VOC family protein [unclassified Calothrix]MBD2202667.1 VOC family protein [Calothrix sp. FACHB-168]MBD2218820.1 VOC family protein [Calothrix sp. FACHB-1219]